MKRLLIVDDAMENMDEMIELLSPIYDVTFSNSSLEALVMVRQEQFDLLMIDITLPEMHGFELLGEIKKLDTYKDIPIIMVSQILMEEEINQGFFLGATEFLTKPYHKQLVLRRIKNLLDLAKYSKDSEEVETSNADESMSNMYRMLENLCEVIESKDYHSGVHIMRSGHYYKLLLNELMKDKKIKRYFSDVDLDDLIMASKMHDIGKIATPDNILNKPGSLTRFEFETMKNHAYNGYNILKRMSKRLDDKQMIQYSEEIALNHHEKWNGKGYPRNLMQDEIPLVARIMSVVDVYDALTSDRIYKKAVSHEQAMDIIMKESGESFDPMVVDAFIHASDKFLNTYRIYREMEENTNVEDEGFKQRTGNEILVIEEDPIAREIINSQLSERGFNVSFATGGMDAIMTLRNAETSFACILTDMELADFSIEDFILLVKKLDSEIIIFSLVDDKYNFQAKRSEAFGFDGCFLKPLDCELLFYRYHHIEVERRQATMVTS